MKQIKNFLPRHPASFPMVCQVCGDVARGLNFNVVTCISCKTFFRRYAYRRQNFKCRLLKNCLITKLTRSSCSCCRLEKCFQLGMDELRIRSVPKYPRNEKRKGQQKLDHTKSVPLPQPQPLDLLRNDRSTLTGDQWNLISNIIHVYDQIQPVEEIRRSFDQMLFLPPKLRSKPWTLLNILGGFYTNVQLLVGRSAHFRSLSPDENHALVKRNTQLVGGMNTLSMYRELGLYHHSCIRNTTISIYGDEIVERTRQNSIRFDPNVNLTKILIFILFFSTNTSLLEFPAKEDYLLVFNSMQCFDIQNFYVTAFWKYLLYLYGFDQAVLRFSSLIKRSLNILYLIELTPNVKGHREMLNKVDASSELLLGKQD